MKDLWIQSHHPDLEWKLKCGKVCLRCKGKTLLVVVNKLFDLKTLLTLPNNFLLYYTFKLTFPPTIWIFTKVRKIRSNLSYFIKSFLRYVLCLATLENEKKNGKKNTPLLLDILNGEYNRAISLHTVVWPQWWSFADVRGLILAKKKSVK